MTLVLQLVRDNFVAIEDNYTLMEALVTRSNYSEAINGQGMESPQKQMCFISQFSFSHSIITKLLICFPFFLNSLNREATSTWSKDIASFCHLAKTANVLALEISKRLGKTGHSIDFRGTQALSWLATKNAKEQGEKQNSNTKPRMRECMS